MKKLNIPTGGKVAKDNKTRFEGVNWDEPIVNVVKSGRSGQSCLKRKVMTRGIMRIRAFAPTKEAIVKCLREGYEVRITDAMDNDIIRLFPCVKTDMKTMFVTAQSMGDFRECIGDKKVRSIHCGKEISDNEVSRLKNEQTKAYKEARRRLTVSPDTMVTCPKCGTEFRVGKQLG